MSERLLDWENKEACGLVLCAESIYAEKMQKVKNLRKQQAEYLASLPTEPEAICAAALKLLHHSSECYPEGFEEALHLSHALRPMIEMLQVETPGPDRDALLWITDRIMFGLENTQSSLDQIGHILGTPGRIKRGD